MSDAEELDSGDSDNDFSEETESASVIEEPTDNQVNQTETDYDDLNKVRDIKKNGCKCIMNCSTKFCENDMIYHIQNFREMDKSDKEMYITGTLMNFDKDKTKQSKVKRETDESLCSLDSLFAINFLSLSMQLAARV